MAKMREIKKWQLSQLAHLRLMKKARFEDVEIYHRQVGIKQNQEQRILTKAERKQVWKNIHE